MKASQPCFKLADWVLANKTGLGELVATSAALKSERWMHRNRAVARASAFLVVSSPSKPAMPAAALWVALVSAAWESIPCTLCRHELKTNSAARKSNDAGHQCVENCWL
mmetsp:Transcript_51950/g.136559  ORF Transcript_51950/g.136559 Transcript_51950/m.136559 type:complete len:109 (+) Transcript_51950:671-997(+)